MFWKRILENIPTRKIEKEIKETYGISVLDAVSDFAKFDLVLRKFFGNSAAKLESKIFRKVIAVERERQGGAINFNQGSKYGKDDF